MSTDTLDKKYTSKDFSSDQDVRWCPGCGDYSILKQMQSVLPEVGVNKEDIVFISGIGCSSRFPYYMDSYGMHGIHGRAPAIASGLRCANPDLSVWVVTGDGDGLSIGGNHLIHALRRNFNVNILLFNNEIYGLTKGQYSPTSPEGKVTKSTPMGSIDHPFNPLALASGADGTFIARSADRDPKHLRKILKDAHLHRGTSLIEIYQNCNVFNDKAFADFTDKDKKPENTVYLEHGQPLKFGENQQKGIRLAGYHPEVVNMASGDISDEDLWIHDEYDRFKSAMLMRFFDDPGKTGALPRPFGIFYREKKACYEDLMNAQLRKAKTRQGEGDLDALLEGENTWEIS